MIAPLYTARMPTTCFVSFEIHPTTRGGCGVLIHHAAEVLLERGHRVVFLLDLPRDEFERFRDRDRLTMPHAERVAAYLVDDLLGEAAGGAVASAGDFADFAQRKSVAFAHALERLTRREQVDYVEFFDYCGPAQASLARRLFAEDADGPVLGVRLHSTLELLDRVGASNEFSRARYRTWAYERASLRLAEAVLTPTQAYYEHYFREAYELPREQVVVSQSPKRPFARVTRRPTSEGEFRVTFLGRMFHHKGVDQFVHAAIMLVRERPALRCTFDLIGYDSDTSPFGGSYVEYLRSSIPRSMHERFHFHGHMTHERIAALLDETLFAVFPNRIESFCYALHEAYDAGVPVIANRLPAFLDFFEHERNALLYDGSTHDLLAQMRRLIDDGPMRERLCRPYGVAERALGDFYDGPRACVSLGGSNAATRATTPLIVVLCERSLDDAAITFAALQGQTHGEFELAALVAAAPGSDDCMPWLGRAWHALRADGTRLGATDLQTRDAIALLRGGDRPSPAWLATCLRGLQRRDRLAFAGTWARRAGKLFASQLDVLPELHPFECDASPTRTLIRTSPGEPLVDALDPNLGALGEIGLIWDAIAAHGQGCLCPEAMIELANEPATAAEIDAHLLLYLIVSRGGVFADRLSLLSGVQHAEQVGVPGGLTAAELAREVERLRAQVQESQTSDHKLRAARDLGGTSLLRIVAGKVLRKLGGGAFGGKTASTDASRNGGSAP